jgi:hypothetical protein
MVNRSMLNRTGCSSAGAAANVNAGTDITAQKVPDNIQFFMCYLLVLESIGVQARPCTKLI